MLEMYNKINWSLVNDIGSPESIEIKNNQK